MSLSFIWTHTIDCETLEPHVARELSVHINKQRSNFTYCQPLLKLRGMSKMNPIVGLLLARVGDKTTHFSTTNYSEMTHTDSSCHAR